MTTKTYLKARYPSTVTPEMIDEAITIAEVITGTHDWQGIRGCPGSKGLVCLVQEYIDSERLLRVIGFLAYEDNGEYWIGYKK